MPSIGKPTSTSRNKLLDVQIGPKAGSAEQSSKIAGKEKERLLNKLTGYKGESNRLYKDAKEHNKMGKDEFLKLLTVQLKNQDPSNPMEQGKMAAELAQFSQLEQLSNLNKSFDGMAKNKAVEDKFYGASFLGKEVVTNGSSIKYGGAGTSSNVLFKLDQPASKVLVRIFDSKNNMVGEVWKENIGRGNQNFEWDGMRLDGAYAAKGEFRSQVHAWDNNASPMKVETKTTGAVESVFFENGETVLLVNGKKVFLRDVDSFHVPGAKDNINTGANLPNKPSANPGIANSAQAILPSAQNIKSNINLSKLNPKAKVNSYKEQAPTTGLTNIYDR